LAVVIIAALQWRVARNKLRLDLFDRRYKLYDAARKFLSLSLRETKVELPPLAEFNVGVADAEFLFGSDVLKYLEQLRKNALHLRTTQSLQSHSRTNDEIKKRVKTEDEDIKRLISQLDELTKVFSRYLGFADVARSYEQHA
jgi:hypothetical protein